ncbi:hypothetical protein BJN34_21295 [Cupriavidus necator]|uniref:DNA-binding protein n=1 Tax=Cupriavidus necator TaxID=106590 RepID=A0A1U9UVF4_CUPNE|nr:H-NS family nucleoid-associated regulatory protein [Cupriavidus necator]AQV96407.1 hypothetical protein BJN34_21295 [Cupriavidus necator]
MASRERSGFGGVPSSDEEIAAVIAWVREAMERYGLTLDDVLSFPAQAIEPRRLYQNAQGDAGDGEGEMPAWLQRAVNGGQSPEHFRVS